MGTPGEDKTATLEELKAQAERAEKRRRDTQAEYTRNRQELLKAKAELEALKAVKQPKLSPEDEELKFSDPDAWLQKVQGLQAQAQAQTQEAMRKIQDRIELEERQKILRSFVEANPSLDITSQEVQDQIPPVYIKQLEQGKVTFDDFLNKVKKFIEAPKTAAATIPEPSGTDISKLAGGQQPTKEKEDIVTTYSNMTF